MRNASQPPREGAPDEHHEDPHHRHPHRQHPVENQAAALRFYVDTLGFTTLRDNPTPNGGRWIELAPGTDNVIVTLEPAAPDVTRGAIGIRFTTDNAEAAHAALHTAGVDTDEILRWPEVPAMFPFRDPDGNALSITETS